jgi:hypothetical protein
MSSGLKYRTPMIKGFEPLIKIRIYCLIPFFPATRSRTATLLRLHPNHQSSNGLKQC